MVDTKQCPGCGGHFPRHPDFVRTYRRKSKGVVQYGCCLECDRRACRERYARAPRTDEQRARNAERAKRYRELYPERYRTAQKRWRDRKYEDANYRSKRNADQRMTYRLRRERAGTGSLEAQRNYPATYDPYRGPSCGEVVDVAPFRSYLRTEYPDMNANQVAVAIGYAVSDRRLREILNSGTTTIELDTVDRFFTRGLARPDLLNVIYPMEFA